MPRTRQPYPPEFRQQMVQLVKAGRTPEELSREFEPTAQTRNSGRAEHRHVRLKNVADNCFGSGLLPLSFYKQTKHPKH
jgi:transposase-like protein